MKHLLRRAWRHATGCKALCWVGWHSWCFAPAGGTRMCWRCERVEVWSSATEDWEEARCGR